MSFQFRSANTCASFCLLAMLSARSVVCAREVHSPSEESVQEARLVFVQRHGTSVQIDAFLHPGKPPASLKRPKFPKNPKAPEDLADYLDYQAYSMRPGAVFDYVFEQAVYNTYGQGLVQKINTAHPEDDKALLSSLWALTKIPMPEHVYAAVMSSAISAFNREEKKVAALRERREALYIGVARQGGVVGLAGAVLDKERLQQLVGGSLNIRTRTLFDVVQSSLSRQSQVSAYVVSVSDTYLPSSTPRISNDFLDFGLIYPDEPQLQHSALQQISESARCQTLSAALSRFIEQGRNSLQDRKQLASFLRPFQAKAPADATNFVLSSAGPEFVETYEAADADQRREILNDASAYYLASELLFRLSVSDGRFTARER